MPTEKVSLIKGSADRKCKILLKALFALANPAMQPSIAAISVCQTAARWPGGINKPDPVFQDQVLAGHLQILPSLLF